MRYLALVLVLGLVGAVGGASIAVSDQTPTQQIQSLKKQLRNTRNDLADANDEIAAQDAVIADQNDTITRLRARDPLDAVLSRSLDDRWDAVVALWRSFPNLDVSTGLRCGYDRAQDSIPDTEASFTFYRWSIC